MEIMEEIIAHGEVFYDMLLCTTILSNMKDALFEKDSEQIIQFIGESYKMKKGFIEECKKIINGELSKLALLSDQMALHGVRGNSGAVADDVLFDIKGEALRELHDLVDKKNIFTRTEWFTYDHYIPYCPSFRFKQIRKASRSGNVVATRQIGIMLALGIGCEQNLDEAKLRFLQCVLWGDITSMNILAYINEKYAKDKKPETAKMFYEVAELSERYLFSGRTVLSEADKTRADKTKYSQAACEYYVYISTILQDVIIAHEKPNIDFSFVEAITSNTLDFYKRMEYIDRYEEKEWKKVTNTFEKPKRKFGFI